jgi:hypothetical protein
MYIPLANSLREAWLWECDYGFGDYAVTFWGSSCTPGSPSVAEYEVHRARVHYKQLWEMAKDDISPQLEALLGDAWKRGPSQSLYALPPVLKKIGATHLIAAEGNTETNCGRIDYSQMIPLEDFNAGWGTDLEWWHNNSKPGVVGQEIYGAGGPIWYALWQDEIE